MVAILDAVCFEAVDADGLVRLARSGLRLRGRRHHAGSARAAVCLRIRLVYAKACTPEKVRESASHPQNRSVGVG